ncbi:glycosyltransferase family 4 protein [Halovivax limisalsi]|uniref:glycosyltransferase family 4 protein n=1 Tax=Halovivax limisalsi TaxID=1453760 RepID=UPI001FFDBEBE|nr:glycosyltransferase family 4 protein [Halovivax limisalsi]
MKILRIAHTVHPDVTGGAAYHVHAMSRDQAAMGHDVTVLTIRHDPSAPSVERVTGEGRVAGNGTANDDGPSSASGYTLRRYDPTVSPLGNDVSVGLARHFAGADGYDVIHAHSHLYFSTNLAALRRTLGSTPLAITNHGVFSQNAPRRYIEAYLRTLGRATLDAADVVFCYTDVDRSRLRSYGVRTPIAVVPNGIDRERFSPGGPVTERIAGEGDAVLFVGRLVEGKRPGLAVDAVDRLRDRRPAATLYVCGDGPLRSELDATAREAGEAVQFLGEVPHEAMPACYRAADALVLPSRAEGVPRTVLEAQAAGVPVVATDLPQLRPVATSRDRLVGEAAPAAFAEALDAALAETTGVGGRRSIDSATPATSALAGDGSGVDATTDGSPPETDRPGSWELTVARTTRILESLTEGDGFD